MAEAVEFFIRIRDNVEDVSKKTQGSLINLVNTFASAQTKGMQTFAALSKFSRSLGQDTDANTTSIGRLKNQIDALRSRREHFVNVGEIKKANVEIAKLEHQLRKLEHLPPASFGQRMRGFASSIGPGLFPLAGVSALGGAFSYVIKEGAGFEQAMSKVRAITGASETDFLKLKTQAEELGAKTAFSATQAAEGMKYLAQAGFKNNEIMAALPATLNLAAAGNIDLGQAANIASNILSGYGMQASELGKVNDVLAKTFTSTNTDLRMLGESFSYVAPVAKGAGQDFNTVSAIIGLLGNAGIQGSRGGTTLAGAITRLQSPSKEAADALYKLGIVVNDSQGRMLGLDNILKQFERSGASSSDMIKIFGQEAGPGMVALLGQGTAALETLRASLDKSGGTADRLAKDNLNNLHGDFTKLMSSISSLSIKVFDVLQPAFRAVVQGATAISDALNSVSEWITQNKNIFDALSVALTAVGVVAGGVGLALAFIHAPMIAASVASSALTAATWLLNAAFWANPITWVVAGVLALGAIIGTLYYKFETFRGVVHGLWEVVKSIALAWWDLQGAMLALITLDFSGFVNNIRSAFGKISGVGDAFKKGYNEGAGKYKQTVELETITTGESSYAVNPMMKRFMPQGVAGMTAAPNAAQPIVQGAQPKVVESIEGLTKELDRIKSLRDKSVDKAEILGYNKDIKGLERRLKLLKGEPSSDDRVAKSGIDGITGGGSRPTNITINLGKFMDNLIIQAQNTEEALPDIERQLKELLLRVLNSANQLATT